MTNRNYAAYKAAEPYFDLVRGALGDLVDGEHFFDVVDEHTVYEVLYDLGDGRGPCVGASRSWPSFAATLRP